MGEWSIGHITTLLLEVFTQRNFAADNSIKIEFYFLKRKSLFEPPFRGLRGNVRTSYIARWKVRARLSIRHNQGRIQVSEN